MKKNFMKMCHVVSGYLRDDARNFQRQAKTLATAGHDVVFVTNDGLPYEEIDGIPFFPCPNSYPRWKTLFFAKSQFLETLLRIDADVYQLHSPELLPLVAPLKRLGKRVVYDAHEDLPRHIWEKEWIPWPLRRPLGWLVDVYMRYVLSMVDEVISPHEKVVRQLQKVVGKGVVVTNFPIVKSGVTTSLASFVAREPLVCYSGTVYNFSNQRQTLKAIVEIPEVRYAVAGFISPELKASLERMPGAKQVNFLGRISQPAVQALYSRCVAGLAVLDYRYNQDWKRGTYAVNKLFEYMEAGIPIICTDYVLWQEIVDQWHCGICVKPGDPAGIRDAIQTLLDDRALAFEMGKNGRMAVECKLNWASQAPIYLRVMESLA